MFGVWIIVLVNYFDFMADSSGDWFGNGVFLVKQFRRIWVESVGY